MKKQFIYLLGLLILGLGACNPDKDWDDMYDDLVDQDNVTYANHNGKTVLEGTEYTLTEDDYTASSNENVSRYLNFSASAPAGENIPEIFNALYYSETAGTEYTITYNYYQGSLGYLYDLTDDNVSYYELTNSDYDSFGTERGEPGYYNNFAYNVLPDNYLPDFFAAKYSNAVAGDMVYVTYEYYDNGTSTVSEFYEFDGTTWAPSNDGIEVPAGVNTYVLNADDYDSMGAPGNYNNFSGSTPAEDYLPAFLKLKFPYAKDGDKIATIYKYYAGGGVTETRAIEYTLTNGVWTEYSSLIEKTDIFKYNGSVWSFVAPVVLIKSDKAATIEYTLTEDDYELVGNGHYDNFDVRDGKAEETEEVRIAKITTILKANFDIVAGDIFKVTYEVYSGSAETWDITLEAVEDN